ncbi:MAG: RusA family crossover junction endodeoxyribonuclease [Candidatus Peribacteraceae bacterium]|nr:RusA family crossover junction endodeoxyribonuclease [Candidatus Peribacteraceae bacterium]
MITLRSGIMSNQQLYNSMCRGKRSIMYMCGKGKKLKEQYIKEVIEQYKGKLHIEDLELDVKYYFGTRHKRDIDNYAKLILDSMEGIVYEDDKQIKKITIEKFYDKENPRIEIIIKPYIAF